MLSRRSTVLAFALRIFANSLLECSSQSLVAAPQYVLIIDAGSSGSRLRMYNRTDYGVAEIHPHEDDEKAFETEPGVSSYAGAPADAGPSLDGLIEAAAKYIPEDHQSRTPLWVKATAGMRLIPPKQLHTMFGELDKHLEKSKNPFKFMGSEVLGGEEEAVFAWISMNNILGTIFEGYTKTSGILDMGGASMQVAFNPGQDIMSNEFSFYVGGKRMSVYAKSFIQFGLATAVQRSNVVARDALDDPDSGDHDSVPQPCFNKGYTQKVEIDGKQVTLEGSGDPHECEHIVKGLLHQDYECLLEPCSIMGVHMPKIHREKTYYAIANFFYVANGLGLIDWGETKSITPKEILDETRTFCKLSVDDAKAHSGAPWKYKKDHCFGGMYMYFILRAYGFEDDADNIVFARKVEGKSADWSMGAALYETQYMPVSLQSRDVSAARVAEEKWARIDGAPVGDQASATVSKFGALAILSGLALFAGLRFSGQARRGQPSLFEGAQLEANE